MLQTALEHPGPAAVRYPRGGGPGVAMTPGLETLPWGQAAVRRQGDGGVALLAFGSMVAPALEAAEGLDATVVNMRFVKPLDGATVSAMAETHELLAVVEENVTAGGAGAAVAEALAARGIATPLLLLGLPDRFVEHGGRGELLHDVGLDAEGIAAAVRTRLGTTRGMAAGAKVE
jgi:1-deoxy-D-xylulose-5-phosphate synthase